MHASVMSQNSTLAVSSRWPICMSTGTVKMMPAFVVLTEVATVCAMLVSRIDPRRRSPRSTPNPSTAAIALPTIVNPILSPAYVIAAFMTTPRMMPKTTALTVTSRQDLARGVPGGGAEVPEASSIARHGAQC